MTDMGPELESLNPRNNSHRTPDEWRIDRLQLIAAKGRDMRESISTRARAAERDVEVWVARCTQAILDDPNAVVTFQPPRSRYDVESPF